MWLPSIICFSIYLNHEQAALAVMSHGSACWYHTDKPLHCSWKKILVFIIWSFKQIIIFIWCFCKHAHCELPLSLCTWTISSPFLKVMQFLCYKNTLTFILLGYLPVSSESGHSIFWLSWTYTCPSRTSHTTPPTSCWKLKRSKSISDRYLTTHRNRFKKFYWYNKLG